MSAVELSLWERDKNGKKVRRMPTINCDSSVAEEDAVRAITKNVKAKHVGRVLKTAGFNLEGLRR